MPKCVFSLIPFSSILFVWHAEHFLVFATQDFYDEVAKGGKSGEAAIHMKMSSSGINYVTDIASNVINEVAPKLRLPDFEITLLASSLKFADVRISEFKPPESYSLILNAPNGLTWRSQNMDVQISGDASSTFLTLIERGDFRIDMNDVNFLLKLRMGELNGYPQLYDVQCELSIAKLDFNLYDLENQYLQRLFRSHWKLLTNLIKPQIGYQLCFVFKSFLIQQVNTEIRAYDLKTPLLKGSLPFNINDRRLIDGLIVLKSSPNQTPNTRKSIYTSKAFEEIVESFRRLYLDFSLTKEPTFSRNTADFDINGEVSWLGNSGTPFFAHPLNIKDTRMWRVLERSFYVTLSDYTFNSMFYHAYKKGKLEFNINKIETPEFAKILSLDDCTKVGNEICLGNFAPEIGQTYPNHDVNLKIKLTQSPALIVVVDQLKMILKGEILLSVFELNDVAMEKPIARVGLSGTAASNLTLNNDQVHGDFSFSEISANLINSHISGFDQFKVEDIIKIGSIALESLINEELRKGFPVPKIRIGKLINPKMRLLNRQITLEMDFEVDQSEMQNLVQRVVDRQLNKFSSLG